MGLNALFGGVYEGKKVLLTGHTGFKGSWLALWLQRMGAIPLGYALPPETDPNHSLLLGLDFPQTTADVRSIDDLRDWFAEHSPDGVFHLAAQSVVRRSYHEPLETIATNVMGTANLLECCRSCESVRAAVIVTSDKCYENREWVWGYRESDALGGYDPYSASKGCAEIVTGSYRRSFFSGGPPGTLVASARAGNVIGGGDWSEDRLIPDVVRAVARDEAIEIREPHSTRPWQHVLECLSGYLTLGARLLRGDERASGAWNFGPDESGELEVEEVMHLLQGEWDRITYRTPPSPESLHEATRLKLDSSQARALLGWRPVWNVEEAIQRTASWYRAFLERNTVPSEGQLSDYVKDARDRGLEWARL